MHVSGGPLDSTVPAPGAQPFVAGPRPDPITLPGSLHAEHEPPSPSRHGIVCHFLGADALGSAGLDQHMPLAPPSGLPGHSAGKVPSGSRSMPAGAPPFGLPSPLHLPGQRGARPPSSSFASRPTLRCVGRKWPLVVTPWSSQQRGRRGAWVHDRPTGPIWSRVGPIAGSVAVRSLQGTTSRRTG